MVIPSIEVCGTWRRDIPKPRSFYCEETLRSFFRRKRIRVFHHRRFHLLHLNRKDAERPGRMIGELEEEGIKNRTVDWRKNLDWSLLRTWFRHFEQVV